MMKAGNGINSMTSFLAKSNMGVILQI